MREESQKLAAVRDAALRSTARRVVHRMLHALLQRAWRTWEQLVLMLQKQDMADQRSKLVADHKAMLREKTMRRVLRLLQHSFLQRGWQKLTVAVERRKSVDTGRMCQNWMAR